MLPVLQTQFTPLPESICIAVSALNQTNIKATLESVRDKLRLSYEDVQLPPDQIIYDTLGTLIRERKLYHTGKQFIFKHGHCLLLMLSGFCLILKIILKMGIHKCIIINPQMHQKPNTSCAIMYTHVYTNHCIIGTSMHLWISTFGEVDLQSVQLALQV